MSTIPLSEQIEEVGREVRHRERLYPEWVKLRRYKQETADAKLAAMQGAERSLRWLAQNIDWIRPIAEQRKLLEQQQRELENHPIVEAAMAAFPDAEVADIRPIAEPVEPEEADAP